MDDQNSAAAAGVLAAKFAPADPAIWFDAAMAAGFSQRIHAFPGMLGISLEPAPDEEGERDQEAMTFLHYWLQHTPGGMGALWHWMKARDVNVRG